MVLVCLCGERFDLRLFRMGMVFIAMESSEFSQKVFTFNGSIQQGENRQKNV